MSILHIINRMPSACQAAGDVRLQRVRACDAVLFIEDGCYAVRRPGSSSPSSPSSSSAPAALTSLTSGVPVFALQADLEARGLVAAEGVRVINYDGFVDLTTEHNPVISWR